jgi:hypothetical protein
MDTAMRELRTAVMVLVDAAWEDSEGKLQTSRGRMEDKSLSGACIRIKRPVAVGTKLVINSRPEKFSGTCKYCRSEGWEYLVGIQRDAFPEKLPNSPRPEVQLAEESKGRDAPPVAARMQEPIGPESGRNESLVRVTGENDAETNASTSFSLIVPPFRRFHDGLIFDRSKRLEGGSAGARSRHEDFNVRRRARLGIKEPPKGKEVRRERKLMGRNWLEKAPWNNKQESLAVTGQQDGPGNQGAQESVDVPALSTREKPARERSAREKSVMERDESSSGFQVDLLPMQEIYRAAGVVSPHKGYSVHKVVEMLHSEHIRGLSTELKRAAVLMALDAAGVALEQIQQDAKARQDALDRYEAEQAKQADAEWARRAEENEQIQAELERVKAHYMARINRNLEGVAREKATFNEWLTQKKQESDSMAEAVSLCAKTPLKPTTTSLELSAAAGSHSNT